MISQQKTEANTWRTFSIFISSTFADMQAERDYLKTFVFPRMEEKLEKDIVTTENIDLMSELLKNRLC